MAWLWISMQIWIWIWFPLAAIIHVYKLFCVSINKIEVDEYVLLLQVCVCVNTSVLCMCWKCVQSVHRICNVLFIFKIKEKLCIHVFEMVMSSDTDGIWICSMLLTTHKQHSSQMNSTTWRVRVREKMNCTWVKTTTKTRFTNTNSMFNYRNYFLE